MAAMKRLLLGLQVDAAGEGQRRIICSGKLRLQPRAMACRMLRSTRPGVLKKP